MRITFRIHYNTNWGQQIALSGSPAELGQSDPQKAVQLQYLREGDWQLVLEVDKWPASFDYKYLLINDQGDVLEQEWGIPREVSLDAQLQQVIFRDSWRSRHNLDNAFYSSAFQNVIFRATPFSSPQLPIDSSKTICRFQIHAPRLQAGTQLCVCGNIPELGNWDSKKALLLGNEKHPRWSGDISVRPTGSIEYKYGIHHPETGEVLLESGENRKLSIYDFPSSNELLCLTDEYFQHPKGQWKAAGVAMPVFSLRSQNGFGVGEFADLPLLVDWADSIGLKMVQILPINDTAATGTWVDSYPYASISTLALHPLYLRIDKIDGFAEVVDQEAYQKERDALNALDKVDYEAVMRHKLAYAKAIYDKKRTAFLKSAPFKQFLKESEDWLKAYAYFCHLRDKFGTVDFSQWGEDAVFSKARLKKACGTRSAAYKSIGFYYFLQFHLDAQLQEAAAYARGKGLILKGDIPIGIYRYSTDAWVEPQLYNMNGQSGAPPDPFSDSGQNWGFPTYNWAEMAKDGYQWWQRRFQQLSRYFDTFRIDHILGFFRIWQIPLDQVEGTMGFFNPALPVGIGDFRNRGIYPDVDRFCKPYITAAILQATFGEEAAYVEETFLDNPPNGPLTFKADYDSQQKVKQFFEDPAHQDKAHLQEGLYQLQGNVLFFEEPGSNGQAFHPRIDFHKTSSFRALDGHNQHRLKEIHDDYFYHRQEEFWREQAMVKLPAIKEATNMLICGEDLGMVPACVPGVMRDLGILTLEIQRMSKNPQTEFLQDKDIPYLSVCSPSTHDMAPIRAWWEEMDPNQRRRFYHGELFMAGEPPAQCQPEAVKRIIWQHLSWPSMWAVFPIQDLLALDENLRLDDPQEERINIPAIIPHYWRYRLHLSIEELQQADSFNEQLKEILQATGRVG
ncbi:MAG: 4-alpha-glucanotransferase [Bacteroidota bacterium]